MQDYRQRGSNLFAELVGRFLMQESSKMDKFKIGDVVRLKSGGPKMTIGSQSGEWGLPFLKRSGYKCQWFEEFSAREGVFAEDILISEPVDATIPSM